MARGRAADDPHYQMAQTEKGASEEVWLMTNREKLIDLLTENDEADFAYEMYHFIKFSPLGDCKNIDCSLVNKTCNQCIADWLNKEAKE